MNGIVYQYEAVAKEGGRKRGTVTAPTREEAYRHLVARGLRPLRLRRKRKLLERRASITLKDLSHFTYQLSVLVEASIPMVDGLFSLAEEEPNARLREIVADVAIQVEAGNTVSSALRAHEDVFGQIYIETIYAAEQSGNMTKVLGLLAEMLDRQYEVNKTVRGAMLYPFCVFGAIVLGVTFLMIFVIPRFATMFAARGIELPLPTQIVVTASAVLRGYWYVFILSGVAGIFGLRSLWRHPASRRRIDTLLHVIPFVRAMLRGVAVSRFADILGISIRSGLDLLTAIDVAARVSGRPLLEADASRMKDQVNHGGRLVDVLGECRYLPAFARRMLRAGEEAGELTKMCEIVARTYDREIRHLAKNISTVIEPVMVVGLAGVVLVIALAIFLPMWNMTALLS